MIVGHIGGSSSGGYEIQKSLRFRASASAYLSRTPSVAGNRKTWTWSGWVKRGALGTLRTLFGINAVQNDSQAQAIFFGSDDKLYVTPWTNNNFISNAVFRDPSAWYHVTVSFDSTNAIANNRVIVYVNGVNQSGTYPLAVTLNADYGINQAGSHRIGDWPASGFSTFDGYLSEINFIDGQALGPSYFGEFSAETGAWIPKKYTGTYGTNGFYLPFNDGSTLGNLAADRSGNGNNWTANSISLTSGVTYDSMLDVPTQWADGGNGRGNYCVINANDTNGSAVSVTNGNLTFNNSSGVGVRRGTLGLNSGKMYFEITQDSTVGASTPFNYGMASLEGRSVHNNLTQSFTCYTDNAGGKAFWRTTTAGIVQTVTPSSFTVSAGDILQFAYDAATGYAWIGKNNVWYDSSGGTTGNPSTGANPVFTLPDTTQPMAPIFEHAGGVYTASLNCGQRPFAYTPPTGFKALCTKNLPEVPASLLDPTDHHIDITVTKSGDTNFTLPWDASVYDTFFEIKRRDASGDWYQIDGLRGYDKILKSNSTAAETTDANVLGVSGTTCTLKSTLPNGVYIISATKAGLSSARQTNTDGSITSTVSRNVVSGFAIVTYTGTGAGSATVGHGLGVAPSFVIVKQRDAGGALYAWNSYHISLGGGSYVQLNTTSAAASDIYVWSNTAPSSTVITLGSSTGSYNQVNNYSGCRYVAYCYADSAIQKSFSYKGNGSTDGPYVNLGFKCGRSLIKATTVAGYDWVVFDSARSLYNPTADHLYPNGNWAEGSTLPVYFNSNGIKIRTGNENTTNGNGHTYIGHAWAAVTGKYSNAR